MNKDFSVKILPVYFWIFMLIFSSLAVLSTFYNKDLLCDTLEHIHASYLISIGAVPYRDFFEHHNPLLWYLFAPLTKLFYRDVNIIYIAQIIAVLGYFYIFYLIFSLSKMYQKSSSGSYLAIIFLLFFSNLIEDIQNFRPDIFMYISILLAVKNFFKYLDTYKLKYLCISYFLWFIAFLFLQKALFSILGFGLANLWLIYKNKLPRKDIFKASLLPLICFLILLFILYKYDLIYDYFNCNYIFNMIMKDNYGQYPRGLALLPLQSLFIAMLISRVFNFSDKGLVLISIWFTTGFSIYYFGPHPQYYMLYFILSSILLSSFFSYMYKNNYMLILVISTLFLSLSIKELSRFNYKLKTELDLIEYTIKNSSPTEKFLNGNYSWNIFNPDTDYYWFAFDGIAILADLYTERHFDYDEQIKKHKPKFLFLSDVDYDRIVWNNSLWLRDRNYALLQKSSKGDKKALSKRSHIGIDYWQIDMDYIKKHYQLIGSYNSTALYQRVN